MIRFRLLSLLALAPLALNVPAAAAETILMPLCTGDGQVRMIPLAGGGPAPTGSGNGCCIKGCHAGSCRKKSLKEIEPAQ
jgi:hypothetical protein